MKNIILSVQKLKKTSNGVKASYADGRPRGFPKDAHKKGHKTLRKNLQKKYKLLSFE